MTRSTNYADHLQSNLRELESDISSCIYFISGNLPGLETEGDARWQFGVDAIARCLKTRLVRVRNFRTLCHDDDSFLSAITSYSPFEAAGMELRNATFLTKTNLLQSLLDKHFPSEQANNLDLNTRFIAELEALFDAQGVGWSPDPIVRVRNPEPLSTARP